MCHDGIKGGNKNENKVKFLNSSRDGATTTTTTKKRKEKMENPIIRYVIYSKKIKYITMVWCLVEAKRQGRKNIL